MMNTNIFDEKRVVRERIAETQGEIYQLAYERGYDMEDFSDKYLRSDFCRLEMDALYSKFQTEFGDACMDELMEEFENKNISVKMRDNNPILYSPAWIGQMYRYLFYALRAYSSELAEKISVAELAACEPGLEDCDTKESIELLVEVFGDSFAKAGE